MGNGLILGYLMYRRVWCHERGLARPHRRAADHPDRDRHPARRQPAQRHAARAARHRDHPGIPVGAVPRPLLHLQGLQGLGSDPAGRRRGEARVTALVATAPLTDDHVPRILEAFDLGSSGRLSSGPVASGRLGWIWRLDTERGSWAVKRVGDAGDDEVAELLEGAAFQEAVLAAGTRRPRWADAGARGHRRLRWGAGQAPQPGSTSTTRIQPRSGRGRAARRGAPSCRLRRLDRRRPVVHGAGRGGAVGRARDDAPRTWRPVRRRARCAAPGARRLGGVPRWSAARAPDLSSRPLGRQRPARADGGLCVFDFDNAGLADRSQELAAVLVEYGAEPGGPL